MSVLLSINNLSISFGGLKAVDNVNFEINKSELLGLIGPNGAGKTTVFNIISGFYSADAGSIKFENQEITEANPAEVNHFGLARTFQNIRLFKNLTVLENVLMALQQRSHNGSIQDWYNSLFNTAANKSLALGLKNEAMALLEIFELDKYAEEISSALPYGAQRKLEIVRALGTKPKLLMLDEPAAGMNHQETAELNVRSSYLLDRIFSGVAGLHVEESDILDLTIRAAQRYRMTPDEYLNELRRIGQYESFIQQVQQEKTRPPRPTK